MVSFKQYLNETPAQRAAWAAGPSLTPTEQRRLVNDVDRALNASVRAATGLNYITHAQWFSTTTVKSNNLRLAMNVLSPPLRKTAVVFHMDIRDERPLTVPSPLSKDQLPFDAVVIVDPINGDMIAVPSLRQPLKSVLSSARGSKSDAFRIRDIVKAASKNLTFYARNHHSTRRG
jgi:hypothetical protein